MSLKDVSEDEIEFCYKVANAYFKLDDPSRIDAFVKNIIMNEIYNLSKKDYNYIYSILLKHKDVLEFVDAIYPLKNILSLASHSLSDGKLSLPEKKLNELLRFAEGGISKLLSDNIEGYSSNLLIEVLESLSAKEYFEHKLDERYSEYKDLLANKIENMSGKLFFDLYLDKKYHQEFPELFEKKVKEVMKGSDAELLFYMLDKKYGNNFSEERAKELMHKINITRTHKLSDGESMRIELNSRDYRSDALAELNYEELVEYYLSLSLKELFSIGHEWRGEDYWSNKNSALTRDFYYDMVKRKLNGISAKEILSDDFFGLHQPRQRLALVAISKYLHEEYMKYSAEELFSFIINEDSIKSIEDMFLASSYIKKYAPEFLQYINSKYEELQDSKLKDIATDFLINKVSKEEAIQKNSRYKNLFKILIKYLK
jgi:hypothetical protein